MTVSFSFQYKAFFLSTVTGHQTSDSTKTVAPWPKGPVLPKAPGDWNITDSKGCSQHRPGFCSKWSCWVVFLCHPLPWCRTTAGLSVEECFVLALPAWASFFCPGMRKQSKMFLYHSEPTWGLGISRQILIALKCRESFTFSASTHLGVLQYPATEAALQQVMLSVMTQGNLPAVTQGWKLRYGSWCLYISARSSQCHHRDAI